LLIAELAYFRIADRYNIIDKPNERSSHTSITLRGGGIIFPFSVLAYFVFTGDYIWFTLGLLAISTISFLDDILTLSGKVRILVHLLAVSLLFYQAELFAFHWAWVVVSYVLVIGTINAYNFMDGINGITGLYSLSVLVPLYLLNDYHGFVQQDFIIYTILGVVVFLIFNFRQKAKCFAGDVGSVSMAFIVLFLITKLIIVTEDYKYILLLAVYGVDSVLTIAHRILLKENIFEAHRRHLYQYLSNEIKLPHLLVSTIYAFVQVIISGWVVYVCVDIVWWHPIAVLIFLGVLYIIVKYLILKGKIKPVA
jgi:UDP-N-acetylmuramyl pentapeptide phosphotransferase/UDP-N-acetylglucosamine-1-phosphate transferase